MISRAVQCKTACYQPVPRITKRCRFCQQEFIGTPGNVYCSRQCCQKYSDQHRKPRKRKRRWHQKKERGPFVCRYCGNEYTTTRPKGEGEQFCSRDCSFAHLHENATQLPCSVVYFKYCEVCSKYFVSRRSNAAICSDACLRVKNNLSSLERSKDLHRQLETVTECAICGVRYCLLYSAKQMKYCSDECFRQSDAYINEKEAKKKSKRIRRHRSRVNGYYELFDPFDIFERDGWRCQCCGIKTPKNKRGTYFDNAPELDHIIPVSRGGDHSRANVRLSCRRCNMIKGNGSLNDQLLLFG